MRKSYLFTFIAILVFLIFSFITAYLNATQTGPDEQNQLSDQPSGDISEDTIATPPTETGLPTPSGGDVTPAPASPTGTEPPGPAPTPWPPPFEPYATEETRPERMLASWGTMADGRITDNYSAAELIDFDSGEFYSQIDGVTTFRGNNFRDNATFGFSDIRNAKFGSRWSRNSGRLTAPDGVTWSGHGWTGQPLIVRWPKQTREIMNMHPWAKEQDELIEVIYAAMDGYIYFNELETGAPTRDKYNIGFTFKGSGAVDPRGYPLLYVGAGYESTKGAGRIFIISLVDGAILHTFGNADSFAQRRWWFADGAPLVDAGTDSLIYPIESGLVYIIKLNSVFDQNNGTMSINPSTAVKWRYYGRRTSRGTGGFWLGFESSAVIWRGHLIVADNGGHLICLDLNTLEPVWVQDVLDDTNSSPVLELEDGHPYIYISTSFHGGWRAPTGSTAVIPVWKIDAMNGEIVWHNDFQCYTVAGISGGVQGTIAPGQYDLEHLIFVPVARTPTRNAGILAAIDKRTGETIWEFQTRSYSWSSPVCVYTSEGKGYILYTTSGGLLYLIDGLTGVELDSIQLGGTIEASPAVFENTVVIGTRGQQYFGVQLT